MIPRDKRLSRQQDIVRVVRLGKKIITPYIIIHAVPAAPDQAGSRVACVVGKKVNALAVKRHKYQRWVRSLAAQTIPGLSSAYDMVWVARPTINEATSLADVKQSLQGRFTSF